MDLDSLPNTNLLKQYWLYALNPAAAKKSALSACRFLEEVKTALVLRGLKTLEGPPIAGLNIDLACYKGNRLVGLDLIGQDGELGDYFALQDYKRFARAGIQVIPLPAYHWLKDKTFLIQKIEQALTT